MTEREQIIETVNKLFIYTDYQEWDKLQSEVLTESVYLDMSSMGADAAELSAKEICEAWREGFSGLDAVNHLAGNYLVNLDGDRARVFAYATATHYRADAKQGQTRDFVGSYNFELLKDSGSWKISVFKYNLKYTAGNLDLK
jgi:hypothetical protein